MHYLVTGGAGFVANVLVRDLLAFGNKVRALDNLQRGNCDSLIALTENPNFEFIRGDITVEEDVKKALDGVDGIYHLASIVGNPACLQNPTLSHIVNVDGTDLILSLKKDEQRLVFCSTECVYGEAEEYLETSLPYPTSLYANQKLQAEVSVLSYPNTCLFRFGAAMGLSHIPRINLLINTLVYEALTNNSLVIFQSEAQRNFISVYDMSYVLQFGMKPRPHKIYNACGSSWSKRELAEYISSKTGCRVFYGDVNKDPDKRDKILDCSRLLSEGFEFEYGIEETINSLIKGLKLINIKTNYS